MKKFFAFLLGFAVVAAVAQVWSPNTGPVPDPRFPAKALTVTIFDSSISNETSTISSTNRVPIAVPVASLAVLEVSIVAADAGTSNVVFSFNTSLDQSLWTTTEPYTASIALNGTNTVRSAVAVGTNIFGNYISFDEVSTTQTNAVTISSARMIFLPRP